MADEVEIVVVVKDNTKAGFAAVARSADALGRKADDTLAAAGSRAGASLADGVSTSFTRGIGKVSAGFRQVEDAGRSTTSKIKDLFTRAGSEAGVGVTRALSDAFSKIGTIAIPLIAPAGALIGAALGAAITVGLAGGFVGLGAFLLKDDPQVQSAMEKTKKTIMDTLQGAAAPLEDEFVTALNKISDWVKENGEELKGLFTAVQDVVAPMTDALLGFIDGALPGLKKGLEDASPFFDKIAEKAPEIGAAVGEFFAKIADNEDAVESLGDLLDALILLIDWTGDAIVAFADFWQWFSDGWAKVFEDAKPPAEDFWEWFSEGNQKMLEDAKPYLQDFWEWFSNGWKAVWDDTQSEGNNFWDGFLGKEADSTEQARLPLDSFWKWFYDGWGRVFNDARGAISSFFSWFLSGWSGTFNSARSAIQGFFSWFTSGWSGVLSSARGALSGFWSWFTSGWANVMNSARSAVSSGANAISSAFSSLVARVRSILQGLVSSAYGIGANIVNGIRNGVINAAGNLASAAASVVRNALQAARNAISIKSPSKDFAEKVGVPISEGMAVGVLKAAGKLTGAVARVTRSALSEASGNVSVGVNASGMGAGMSTGNGSSVTVNLYVAGSIKSERDIVQLIRDEIVSGGLLRGVRVA